jgi:hypothetical protein
MVKCVRVTSLVLWKRQFLWSKHNSTCVLTDVFTPHKFAYSRYPKHGRGNFHPHLGTYLTDYTASQRGQSKYYPKTLSNIREVRIFILQVAQAKQFRFCIPMSVRSIYSIRSKAVYHSEQHTSNTDSEHNCNFTSQCTSSL